LENVGNDGEIIWRMTDIYGYLDDADKHKTWDLLKALNNPNLP